MPMTPLSREIPDFVAQVVQPGFSHTRRVGWYASLAIWPVSAALHDEVRPENKPEYIRKSEEINENWWMRLMELVGLAW